MTLLQDERMSDYVMQLNKWTLALVQVTLGHLNERFPQMATWLIALHYLESVKCANFLIFVTNTWTGVTEWHFTE